MNKEYFKEASVIDVDNHLCQYIISMNRFGLLRIRL